MKIQYIWKTILNILLFIARQLDIQSFILDMQGICKGSHKLSSIHCRLHDSYECDIFGVLKNGL